MTPSDYDNTILIFISSPTPTPSLERYKDLVMVTVISYDYKYYKQCKDKKEEKHR
jgi:hypothetical protein